MCYALRTNTTALNLAAWLALFWIPVPAFAQQVQSAPTEDTAAYRLLPLAVYVNNTDAGQWVLLQRGGVLYAPEDAITEWRLSPRADVEKVAYRGQRWIPLNAVPGFEARFDYASQSVKLAFLPEAFAATRLDQGVAVRPELSPVLPAAFLNYDLVYTNSAYRQATGTSELAALAELGFSAEGGVLTSSFVGHNLTTDTPQQPRTWRRLETTYTHDFLDSNSTFRLGDSSTRHGLIGRTTYFGGVQIGRNFSLTPGFISQPVPIINGVSSAPSSVELYINDVLRQTSSVPTGPFAIDNFPMVTGSGEARVVVRDMLGRETVLEQAFFTHASLLEQDLTDWSTQVGAVRNNFGIENADYGQRFVSGMVRHGMDKSLTLEGGAELGSDTRDASAGLSYALPFQALGQVALGVSQDNVAGSGADWVLGIEKYTLQHGFMLRAEGADRNFRQIGQDAATQSYRLQLSGSYSYIAEYSGAMGMGVAFIDTYDRGSLTTFSANYSARFDKNKALTFTASRVIGSTSGYALGVSFLMPLEDRVVVTSSVTNKAGQTDAYVSASKGLRDESGTGWRALAGTRAGQGYSEGGLYYQGGKGLLSADVNASADQQTIRMGAQGGVVVADSRIFASRRVQDSFALVEVPGYADVGVGFQNSILTRTDSDGVALLTRLQPYQRNSIRLDPTELPISAEIDNIEQVMVPSARSGVKVLFPVRSGRGALLHIVLENGNTAPAGALIEVVGDSKEFFVARRGEAFITGLQPSNSLRMKWDKRSCVFDVTLPPGNLDDIARVGPLVCVEQGAAAVPDGPGQDGPPVQP
jgi:outer membrane usher protein